MFGQDWRASRSTGAANACASRMARVALFSILSGILRRRSQMSVRGWIAEAEQVV
jgi:hypothetical protein